MFSSKNCREISSVKNHKALTRLIFVTANRSLLTTGENFSPNRVFNLELIDQIGLNEMMSNSILKNLHLSVINGLKNY